MSKTLTFTDIPDEFYAQAVDAYCALGNCQSDDPDERELFAHATIKSQIGATVRDFILQQAQTQAQQTVAAAEAEIQTAHDAVRDLVQVVVQ